MKLNQRRADVKIIEDFRNDAAIKRLAGHIASEL
jgi:hypothetical protein